MMKTYLGSLAVATAMVAAVPAQATSWVFTSGSNTATSGAYGNASDLLKADGIGVTLTAWSTATNSSTSLPQTAFLGHWANATGGFGVTNRNEGDGQDNNSHTIDNVGSYDFIRLEFSTAVKLTGMTLNGYSVNGATDTDAWVSYGNTTDSFATDWSGFLSRGVAVAGGTSILNTNYAKVWLIGADRSGIDRDDGFKLGAITAVALTPSVPEPATWGMMILGFGAIGSAMRRKTATKVTFA